MKSIQILKHPMVLFSSIILSMCSSPDEINRTILPGVYQSIVSDHPEIYKDFLNRNSVFILTRISLNSDSSFLKLDSLVLKEANPEKIVSRYMRGNWIENDGVLELYSEEVREISDLQSDTSWVVDTSYAYQYIQIKKSREDWFIGCPSSEDICFTYDKID